MFEISIIVPCRNEIESVEAFLDSVFSQQLDVEFEVIICDGLSDDGTFEKLNGYSIKEKRLKVLKNESLTTPFALNLAIKESSGKFIARMDMHSVYPVNYLQTLYSFMKRSQADNVGAACDTIAASESSMAKAIAIAMGSRIGVGNSSFRTLVGGNEVRVDTVPFGFYKKEIFDRIGLYDTEMTRNQDDEFNSRLVASGGLIYLLPELRIRYQARKNIKQISSMMWQYGLFKPLVAIKTRRLATFRQLAPPGLCFVVLTCLIGFMFTLNLLLLCPIGLYLICCLIGSLFELSSRSEKLISPIVIKLTVVFAAMHFSYGFGYIYGIYIFGLLRGKRKNLNNLSLSR